MPSAISGRGRKQPAAARPADVVGPTINVHAAKTHLSRLLARVERGERITIARAGKPVAVIAPPPAASTGSLAPDDPLLNLDAYGFDGPGGSLTNREIDRAVYSA
jgi:prevent-host-death family protein